MPLVFMRDRRLFDRFYTFEGAAESDFAAWRDALLWFLKVNAADKAAREQRRCCGQDSGFERCTARMMGATTSRKHAC